MPQSIPELDLHHYRPSQPHFIQQEIEQKIDKFLSPYLRSHKITLVRIVVGRGLNSNRLIKGLNPLRYYTQNYLDRLGLEYKSGGYFDGQDGVLIVNLD